MSFRIGHLSDIHVPAGVTPSVRDICSKRITGYLNFKLKREQEYEPRVLSNAVDRLIRADVDIVIVSGDLSNLAYHEEFDRAYALLSPLDAAQIPWLVIPGNHDRYLRRANDGYMEQRFSEHLGQPLLPGKAYPWISEQDGAMIVGLNSAVANAPFQAWGRVSTSQLAAVESASARLQLSRKPIVITVHHHLGKAPNKRRDRNRNLRNSKQVLKLAQQLRSRLVLHGHNHFLDIRDMAGMRIFAASSGISNRQGTHRAAGQVAIHTLDDRGTPPTHDVAFWQGTQFGPWTPMSPHTLPPAHEE